MLGNGLLLLDWAQLSINEWVGDDCKGSNQYLDRSPNALGESVAERHLALGVIY